ncbi:MAG: glycoside hydrolase family 5 protein [Lachnospiraceae bacterium]|nr:glycoside hydrolase family 5 protein [Lachnospiraceae bacterium]
MKKQFVDKRSICLENRKISALLACIVLCMFCAFGTHVTVHAKASKVKTLYVKSGKLCDKKGKTIQLRGVSSHGMSWYPEYMNGKMIKELHSKWKANVIRLAIYTEEYNGYCSGDANNRKVLKKKIDECVTYATKYRMYVIIDWHILSDGNPNTHKKEAKKFFAEMAKKYRKHTNVIYEICNEPNGGTDWNTIRSYAISIIKTIRKHDKRAVILVGTPNWCQEVEQAADKPIPSKYKNIMYTMHFYADTHRQDYRDRLIRAREKKLPIFISEFGICDASGSGAINKTEAKKWLTLLDKNKISYVAWNLSNKSETSAMIKPECSKVNKIAVKDLSPSGKWIYKHLRARAK